MEMEQSGDSQRLEDSDNREISNEGPATRRKSEIRKIGTVPDTHSNDLNPDATQRHQFRGPRLPYVAERTSEA